MEHSHFLIPGILLLTEKILVDAADVHLSMGLYASVWNNYLGGEFSVGKLIWENK